MENLKVPRIMLSPTWHICYIQSLLVKPLNMCFIYTVWGVMTKLLWEPKNFRLKWFGNNTFYFIVLKKANLKNLLWFLQIETKAVAILFWIIFMFIGLFLLERHGRKTRERESSVHWFTHQMATAAGAELLCSQDPGSFF